VGGGGTLKLEQGGHFIFLGGAPQNPPWGKRGMVLKPRRSRVSD